MDTPSINPFRRFGFILGARGGAKGHNPFPAARTDRFRTGRRFHPKPVAHKAEAEINHVPQPWQKAAAKAKERALKKPHLGWNERRLDRDRRKESEAQLREDLAQVA